MNKRIYDYIVVKGQIKHIEYELTVAKYEVQNDELANVSIWMYLSKQVYFIAHSCVITYRLRQMLSYTYEKKVSSKKDIRCREVGKLHIKSLQYDKYISKIKIILIVFYT